MRNPVFLLLFFFFWGGGGGGPSSCEDVQPQRTSLVSRPGHNLLNKNKSVEQWRGNRTFDLCLCILFFAKTGFLVMRLINKFYFGCEVCSSCFGFAYYATIYVVSN